MAIHPTSTRQQFTKGFAPNRAGNGEPNRTPKAVAPPYPIGKTENATRKHAKIFRRGNVCRDGRKMISNRFHPSVFHQPVPCRFGIGHGFLGGEGFADHDEERLLRLHLIKHGFQVRSIDIADKMQLGTSFSGCSQCLRHH